MRTDYVEKGSTFYAKSGWQDNIWIGFDDEESIRLKAQYALSRNLAGVMFWNGNYKHILRNLHYAQQN